MSQKIIAVLGTYRKDGITDQIVEAALRSASSHGAQTEKVYLSDQDIKFCKNCRCCGKSKPHDRRGECVLRDDMNNLLDKIDIADGLILASPINFYTVTAVMKRFVERLIVYAYWPWEQPMPRERVKAMTKKAVVVTSSACPAFIAKLLMPNATQILKDSAKTMGAKVVSAIHFGAVCQQENQRLNQAQVKIAEAAGILLIKGTAPFGSCPFGLR